MKLLEYLKIHFNSMKQDQADGRDYELGVRIYLIGEHDFDDFVPEEYVSDTIKNHENFSLFKHIEKRSLIKKTAYKLFSKNFRIEHFIPKKFIIKKFKEKECDSPEKLEEIIRKNLILAYITRDEDKRLPRYKGRETKELSFKVYKEIAHINIEKFSFDKDKK